MISRGGFEVFGGDGVVAGGTVGGTVGGMVAVGGRGGVHLPGVGSAVTSINGESTVAMGCAVADAGVSTGEAVGAVEGTLAVGLAGVPVSPAAGAVMPVLGELI